MNVMVRFTLDQFETIGTANASILRRKASIRDVDEFLARIRDGRVDDIKERVKESIPPGTIDTWCEIMELFTVPKVSTKMAEMLVHARVNSVRELSFKDPVQLLYKIMELDERSFFIVVHEPSIAEVEEWIYYAKLMSRSIKQGYDVPLISFFPLVTVHAASELQRFRIWTVEDLDMVLKTNLIDVRRRADMTVDAFQELVQLVSLCKLDGVDVVLARALHAIGIKTAGDAAGMNVKEVRASLDRAGLDEATLEGIKQRAMKATSTTATTEAS